MLLGLLGWLCITLPFLTTATPQAIPLDASIPSLPAILQTDIPACAQPCFQKSLAEEFSLACTVPTSLNCLCSTYSVNGQSLGEVALGCVYESCDSVEGSAAEAYNICFGQPGAVRPTHTILTVPARTSMISATMSPTSSNTITESSLITSTPSIQSSQTSSSETIIVDSISTTPTPTATSSPTQSASAAARPPTMRAAQIVGISVAAAGVFLIAILLIFLSVFLRKRREKRKEEANEEKSGWHPAPGGYSRKPSRSFRRSGSTLDLPNQFPIPPVPARRVSKTYNDPKPPTPPMKNTPTIRIVPTSSPPPEQIGLAISAEQPRQSTVNGGYVQPRRLSFSPQRQSSNKRSSTLSQRPESNVTQYTLFEEDDVDAAEPRRQSVLLPTPPMPIPPIRSFRPSRPPPQPKLTTERPMQAPPRNRNPRQRSELFLDIPARHSRILPPTAMSVGNDTEPGAQLAPAIRFVPPQKPVVPDAKTPESQHSSGIPSYYFTSHRHQMPKDSGRTDSPQRLNDPSQASNTKTKLSSGSISRTTSHASTNIRDSWSSQTSFESVDDDDPTPEESNNKLSPVAESPISNLRYPKVPRASNQMVPRSPKSIHSRNSQDSIYWLPEPSLLQTKRRGEQGTLQLGSMVSTGSPLAGEVRSHMRRYRQHLRSNSVDDWSAMPNSERSTKTQSGMWPPKSPMMYEPEVIRPLSIRPKQNQQFLQTPRAETDALKSPVWVPRLTPTRQGEDLLISVTYSKPGH